VAGRGKFSLIAFTVAFIKIKKKKALQGEKRLAIMAISSEKLGSSVRKGSWSIWKACLKSES